MRHATRTDRRSARRPAGAKQHLAQTRRSALKTIAGATVVGSLAGCTETVSDLSTFEATPAWISTTPLDPTLDVDANGNPAGITVKALPTGTSRISVTQQIDPIGEATVTSYGVHQSFIATADTYEQCPYLVLGNVGTLASPSVRPVGAGEQNPLPGFSREEIFDALLNVNLQRRNEDAIYERRMVSVDFDGFPSLQELLAVAYQGNANSVDDAAPISRASAGFGTRGTIELLLQDGSTTTKDVMFFGTAFEDDGDYLISVGWIWQSPAAKERTGDTDFLEEFSDSVVHPSGCGNEGCVPVLKSKATAGLTEAFEVLPRRMRARLKRHAATNDETLALLDTAIDETPDGRDRDLLLATRRDVERLAELARVGVEHLDRAIDAPLRKLPGYDRETEFEAQLVKAFDNQIEMIHRYDAVLERFGTVERETETLARIEANLEWLRYTAVGCFRCTGTVSSQVNL